jgi:hypothetical protein
MSTTTTTRSSRSTKTIMLRLSRRTARRVDRCLRAILTPLAELGESYAKTGDQAEARSCARDLQSLNVTLAKLCVAGRDNEL